MIAAQASFRSIVSSQLRQGGTSRSTKGRRGAAMVDAFAKDLSFRFPPTLCGSTVTLELQSRLLQNGYKMYHRWCIAALVLCDSSHLRTVDTLDLTVQLF